MRHALCAIMLIHFGLYAADKPEHEVAISGVTGDVFIIPNPLRGPVAMAVPDEGAQLSFDPANNTSPFKVELWATSEESENWEEHGHPTKFNAHHFPRWLPVEFFIRKSDDMPLGGNRLKKYAIRLLQEEEHLHFTFVDHERKELKLVQDSEEADFKTVYSGARTEHAIDLKCKQIEYRYEQGPFEAVLFSLLPDHLKLRVSKEQVERIQKEYGDRRPTRNYVLTPSINVMIKRAKTQYYRR